jgi:thiosulfate dehydrogenase
MWRPPDSTKLPTGEADLINYGRELMVNTGAYFGPNGSIAHITNGMNCQNCHLLAGKKIWGNNLSAVTATYPAFKHRSGRVETVFNKVSDCFERSLSGTPPDSSSREMQAIIAYINWVGSEVPKGVVPKGSTIRPLAFLDRPADSARGAQVYALQCARCHMNDGQGVMGGNNLTYQYPPLWGPNSYTSGATLHRVSKLAGFVRYNMPFDVTDSTKLLTDEEAWDVAAFVNSHPRPSIDLRADWPDISKKFFDYPFGPYSDTFSERQHKYGPYGPIKESQKI